MHRTRSSRARLVAGLAVATALLGIVGVRSAHAVTFHGITFQKSCNLTTNVGAPYTCQYKIINADDNDENVVVTSVVDVVHSAGGDVSSGNIIDDVTWTIG